MRRRCHDGQNQPTEKELPLKRIAIISTLAVILATGTPQWAESGIISPLVVLPTTGIQIPSGTDIRLYSAPMLLGSAFFDGKKTSTCILSSDPSWKKLITVDTKGNAVTSIDSDVLAGTSARSGIRYGDNVVVAIDYYPDGGAVYPALNKISMDGTFSEWKTVQGHGGANSIIPGVKNNLFLPAALPSGVSMQTGMTAKVLKSNYSFGPIGNIFFGADGSLYAFTSSPNRKRLAKIDANGSASAAAVSDVMVGTNLRAGAPYNNGYVISVDYAPDTGNQYSGIYIVNSDGTYTEWGLSQSHSGISDLIPDPNGGYYFTDFENDNIWHITTPGQAETSLLKNSPVALWSIAASDSGEIFTVNWIPGEWWSNGGVNAVYRITGDSAELVAQAPEGSQLYSIAAAKGGVFGSSFYVTDSKGGRVLRVESNNTLTPVITGLPNPGRIKFDPFTGNMAVVCDGQYIIWFGSNLIPFAAQSESSESQKGFYFSDFENDNVWFVPGEGQNEIPILESNVPPGLGTITYNDLNDTIYALNWQGTGWPFGGEDAVYQIGSNGVATQFVKGSFTSIAMSKGGPFGEALYVSDSQAGKILKLENGTATAVVSGLSKPGALSFDPVTGNMLVICDSGKSAAWIGSTLGSPAAGDPGTVGMFFVPNEQDALTMAKSIINGSSVNLGITEEKPSGYSAVSKEALTGDFEITASIRMSDKTLQSGQNRDATFSVVSDVAGQKSNQCYIGLLQKTVGYAGTGGQYAVYTDMYIGGWGRFNSRPISGEPYRFFKIIRKEGVLSTWYLENDTWVKLSTATDGFTDRVRVFFSIDTSWDASIGVAHSASFNSIDFGSAISAPSNLTVSDVPNDQGHSLKLAWTASSSETSGLVSYYRIYRSLISTLSDSVKSISQFTDITDVTAWERHAVVLVDSVSAGKTEYIDTTVFLPGVPYYYWIQAVGTGGESAKIAAGAPTSVDEKNSLPAAILLFDAHPNPFNPSTTIEYILPRDTRTLLRVYNVSGQKVATLADGVISAGRHSVVWDAKGMPSGVYFYTLKTDGGYYETKKALLLK